MISDKSEKTILWILAIPIIFFGFYPDPLFDTFNTSVANFLEVYNLNIETFSWKIMDNYNLIFSEIFISISIMLLLIIGVYKKNSSNTVYNISIVTLIIISFEY